MSAPQAAPPFAATATAIPIAPVRTRAASALSRALVGSTLHRIRRGEGALLAVNVSLVALGGGPPTRALARLVVSALAIGLMYAFNDLYDAPTDATNPRKDRQAIATYLEHQRAALLTIVALKIVTAAFAWLTLGARPTAAVVAVMIVNVIYSRSLKGVPIVDVIWVWLWGALYAAIAGASTSLLVIVGLMTSVCHLFQALGDRIPDAANRIRTTAVRSPALARDAMIVLSVLLFAALREPVGTTAALTACTPLAIYRVTRTPSTAWLLTKAYFALMWLYLLGNVGAAG